MILPPRWNQEQLSVERDKAKELFRAERIQEPLEDYLEAFERISRRGRRTSRNYD